MLSALFFLALVCKLVICSCLNKTYMTLDASFMMSFWVYVPRLLLVIKFIFL